MNIFIQNNFKEKIENWIIIMKIKFDNFNHIYIYAVKEKSNKFCEFINDCEQCVFTVKCEKINDEI